MNNLVVIILSVVTIVLAQLLFRNNVWIVKSSVLKLIGFGIIGILTSIFICALLGNKFYELIIITTVCFGSIGQINYSHRVRRYNESGR